MLATPTDLRRHRLVATFLHRCLGLELDELREEVEAVEHAVSARVLERLDVVLGHPQRDPYGDPIPARDGPGAV